MKTNTTIEAGRKLMTNNLFGVRGDRWYEIEVTAVVEGGFYYTDRSTRVCEGGFFMAFDTPVDVVDADAPFII